MLDHSKKNVFLPAQLVDMETATKGKLKSITLCHSRIEIEIQELLFEYTESDGVDCSG